MGKSKKRAKRDAFFAGDPFFAAPAEQKQKRPKQQETTHAAPRATSEAPRRAPGDAERKRPKQAKPKARPGDADRVVAGFHPRNRYRGSYDFDALVAALPDLASALTTNPRTGARTVDWRSAARWPLGGRRTSSTAPAARTRSSRPSSPTRRRGPPRRPTRRRSGTRLSSRASTA